MAETDQVENEIIGALQGVAECALKDKEKGGKWSVGSWTEEIKNRLVELAHKHGFEVSASKCKGANSGEWLFDIAWYKYDDKQKMNKNRKLENVILSMEIEWGNPDDIRVDFEKLLAARTRYRIMVFQEENGANGAKVDEIKNKLIERIKVFQGSNEGDRYLFAGWNVAKQSFEFFPYIYDLALIPGAQNS